MRTVAPRDYVGQILRRLLTASALSDLVAASEPHTVTCVRSAPVLVMFPCSDRQRSRNRSR